MTALRPWSWALADPPIDPDRDQARQWAIDELAKQPYQAAKPGLAQQIWEAISSFFQEMLNGLQNATGADGGMIGVVLLAIAILLVAGLIFLLRPRLLHRRQPDAEVFEADLRLTSEEHRARAAQAVGVADFDAAVAEMFRAIVRSAEERVIIDPQPGRTADEVSARLAAAFGAEHTALRQAAALFNQVRYAVRSTGSPAAGPDDFRWLTDLDESLRQHKSTHDDARLHWVQAS